MAHGWISTADGGLLRADQVRQINTVEGLRVVNYVVGYVVSPMWGSRDNAIIGDLATRAQPRYGERYTIRPAPAPISGL